MKKKNNNPTSTTGFTLLELLIVISIIAIVSAILIFTLNPRESLRRARDSQRISDLNTIKSAVSVYTTTENDPQLDGITGTKNVDCLGGTGNANIWVSINQDSQDITDTSLASGFDGSFVQVASSTGLADTDGTGWIPVNLDTISGGTPISGFPIDPVNDVTNGDSSASNVDNDALMYRYACRTSPLAFEVNAYLESLDFGQGGDNDRVSTDDGANDDLYEVGTAVDILPGTDDF